MKSVNTCVNVLWKFHQISCSSFWDCCIQFSAAVNGIFWICTFCCAVLSYFHILCGSVFGFSGRNLIYTESSVWFQICCDLAGFIQEKDCSCRKTGSIFHCFIYNSQVTVNDRISVAVTWSSKLFCRILEVKICTVTAVSIWFLDRADDDRSRYITGYFCKGDWTVYPGSKSCARMAGVSTSCQTFRFFISKINISVYYLYSTDIITCSDK